MGGGKGKNKKRKNNAGEPMSPPTPGGYRPEGALPTPSPTPSVAMTTAALQQVTIEEETETAGYWKKKCEMLLELNGLLTVANKDYPLIAKRLDEEKKKVEVLETKVENLNTICGLREKMLMDWKSEIAAYKKGMKEIRAAIDECRGCTPYVGLCDEKRKKKKMLAHEKGMEQILAAIDEFVPEPESWESFDCPASGVVHGINRLYDMWKKAEDYQAVVEERVQEQYKDSIAGHDKEREEWKVALRHAEHARDGLKKEMEEERLKRRPKMVDKGVRALPRPEVCSTLTQTDAAGVKGTKGVTWAGVAAGSDSGGGPPPAGEDVEMGGASPPSGGVAPCQSSGRARGLVVHGVSCTQRMAGLWQQARLIRVGGSNTVIGVRWLLGWGRRLHKRVSSVVVYFSRFVNIPSSGLFFGGRRRPVERYEFGRAARETDSW